jgi:SAM-dependent methyltransferase
MKVSSNDMYVNGDYLKNNPGWDAADAPWKTDVIISLLNRNNIRPATVIEVGCGAGENLVELQKKDPQIQALTGYDISPQAFAIAQKKISGKINFHNADITRVDEAHADLMLVIDVVEHVDDYYGFLRKLRSKGDHFVFHIPLDLSARTIMKPHVMLQQRESVGHIHYFSREMVEWALKDTGYEIIDWVYTRPVVDVNRPDSFKRFVKKLLRNTSFAINKDWSAKRWGGYSMMILAK